MFRQSVFWYFNLQGTRKGDKAVKYKQNKVPGGVWCASEEVDAGQAGVSGQDRHHAASGAKTTGIHTDATGFVPQYRHHDLCCD